MKNSERPNPSLILAYVKNKNRWRESISQKFANKTESPLPNRSIDINKELSENLYLVTDRPRQELLSKLESFAKEQASSTIVTPTSVYIKLGGAQRGAFATSISGITQQYCSNSPVWVIENSYFEEVLDLNAHEGPFKKLVNQFVDVKGVHYLSCWFTEVTAQGNPGRGFEVVLETCEMAHCSINFVKRNPHWLTLKSCMVGYCELRGEEEATFEFGDSEVACLHLRSTANLCVRSIQPLALVQHDHLDTFPATFTNVRIGFSRQWIRLYVDDSNSRSYFNSFIRAKECEGLRSERESIERYIGFFRSRASAFHRLFFWFNGAYYEWKWPLAFVLITAISIQLMLQGLNDAGNVNDTNLSVLFNPRDMFGKIVFSQFSFSNDFCWQKLCILVSWTLFLYSSYCFLTALKRKFGFPRNY